MTFAFDGLAQLALDVGCNLAPCQKLVVAAPAEAAALVRALAQAAVARGAADIMVVQDDPDRLRLDLLAGRDVGAPEAQLVVMARELAAGAARVTVLAPRPDLLVGVAPDRIIRAHRAWGAAAGRASALLAGMTLADTAVPFATEAWARLAFPTLDPALATARLQAALATVLRLDSDDPVAAWRARLAEIDRRKAWLNVLAPRGLRVRGPGTDLTLALAAPAEWRGGSAHTDTGRSFAPVLPTEALSAPVAADGTWGRVAFSRPLALAGEVVDGLEAEVEAGRLVRLSARRGADRLESLLASAAEARLIRGVSLVDGNAPGSRAGQLFLNPLLDGCCASGLALGAMSQAGESGALHLDAMFGNAATSVDALDVRGRLLPLMRDGGFAM